jgi:hypothetical protein
MRAEAKIGQKTRAVVRESGVASFGQCLCLLTSRMLVLDHKPRHGVPKKLPVGVDVDTHETINQDYECSFRKVSMAVSGLLSYHPRSGH